MEGRINACVETTALCVDRSDAIYVTRKRPTNYIITKDIYDVLD
jgi:hypothetical protein